MQELHLLRDAPDNYDKPLRVKSQERSREASQKQLLGASIFNNYDRLVNDIDRTT